MTIFPLSRLPFFVVTAIVTTDFQLFLAVVIEVFRGSVFEVQDPFPAYPEDAGTACRLGLVVGVDVVWPPGHGDLIVPVDHPSVAVDVSGCLSCSGVHFRVGFWEGHEKAKELDLYMQKYCGCVFSEEDRYVKKKKDTLKVPEGFEWKNKK